jgi:hypothetical protein
MARIEYRQPRCQMADVCRVIICVLEVVVKITVSVQSAHSQADTRALYKALFNAPAARQGAHVSQVTAPVRPSDMGSTLDVIEFAVGAGFQAAGLVLAIASWRTTKPHRPAVTIRRGEDGVEIEIHDDDPELIAQAIRALEQP